MRKMIFVLSCVCLGLLTILSFKIWHRWRLEVLEIQPPKLQFRAARQIFPYSVIPGGLTDVQELSASIKQDEVVREHYGDLQPSGMWFTRLKKPMLAYVSFRRGHKIGWTSHQVTIPANELVLTDGAKMIRARCGNRITVKKPTPLPSVVQPPEMPPPDIAFETGLPALQPPTVVPPVPPGSDIGYKTTDRTSTPPTTWCCSIVKETPPNVPEPSSIILVCGGALALFTIAGRRLL